MVDLAQRFFGLHLNGRVFTEDAAVAVQQLRHERRGAIDTKQHTREAGLDLARAADEDAASAGGYGSFYMMSSLVRFAPYFCRGLDGQCPYCCEACDVSRQT